MEGHQVVVDTEDQVAVDTVVRPVEEKVQLFLAVIKLLSSAT